MQAQYWVIGGEYESLEFTRLIEETCEVFGPFSDYHEATQAWRKQAMATRYKALARYIIVRSANPGMAVPMRRAAA